MDTMLLPSVTEFTTNFEPENKPLDFVRSEASNSSEPLRSTFFFFGFGRKRDYQFLPVIPFLTRNDELTLRESLIF